MISCVWATLVATFGTHNHVCYGVFEVCGKLAIITITLIFVNFVPAKDGIVVVAKCLLIGIGIGFRFVDVPGPAFVPQRGGW